MVRGVESVLAVNGDDDNKNIKFEGIAAPSDCKKYLDDLIQFNKMVKDLAGFIKTKESIAYKRSLIKNVGMLDTDVKRDKFKTLLRELTAENQYLNPNDFKPVFNLDYGSNVVSMNLYMKIEIPSNLDGLDKFQKKDIWQIANLLNILEYWSAVVISNLCQEQIEECQT